MRSVLMMIGFGWVMVVSATPLKQQDFVGVWQCQNISNEGTYRSLDWMYADGTMIQLWESVNLDMLGNIDTIEFFTVKNRWEVDKDKLLFSDTKIVGYQQYDKYKVLQPQSVQDAYHQMWQEAYKEPWGDLVVLSDDKKTYYSPEAEDSFCTKQN